MLAVWILGWLALPPVRCVVTSICWRRHASGHADLLNSCAWRVRQQLAAAEYIVERLAQYAACTGMSLPLTTSSPGSYVAFCA
mmetsp:Transcript_11193/g.30974  ORF Transcript_11193/g.30974 Transcript_11193/m.30974 type:complete len:83 (-) Transcript_11193:339-587(-)